MSKGDRFWRVEEQKAALKKSEADDQVADSMEVRTALMERVHAGEITLEEAQRQLAQIKHGAKERGLLTRSQAFK